MHPRPAFRYADRDEALAFVAENPFATVAVNGDMGPITALVPLVTESTNCTLLGHVARSNPFWKSVAAGDKAVAIFHGAEAYVSPSNYPSKSKHGRVVPTWNYLAVEIRGQITVETKPESMMPFLTTLTNKMEINRDVPWELADAPETYIEKLSQGIVGFRINVDEIVFVKKMSQNKSPEDRQGVVLGLQNSTNSGERDMAREMQKDN